MFVVAVYGVFLGQEALITGGKVDHAGRQISSDMTYTFVQWPGTFLKDTQWAKLKTIIFSSHIDE